jgi:hypothetical protein
MSCVLLCLIGAITPTLLFKTPPAVVHVKHGFAPAWKTNMHRQHVYHWIGWQETRSQPCQLILSRRFSITPFKKSRQLCLLEIEEENVPVYANFFCSLMDSPRWGVSCNYNASANFLPSCALCHERYVVLAPYHVGAVESMDEIVCLKCLNWNEFTDSDAALVAPPPNYPQELFPPNKMQKAKYVTYEELTLHVKDALQH